MSEHSIDQAWTPRDMPAVKYGAEYVWRRACDLKRDDQIMERDGYMLSVRDVHISPGGETRIAFYRMTIGDPYEWDVKCGRRFLVLPA